MGSQSEFPTHEAPRTAATWVGETNAGLSPGPGPQWRHPTERSQRRGQEEGQRHIPDIRCFLHLICRDETSIFHWELIDIHSRMLDCLQFSIRRLHGWDAPWCWQDIISIHCNYILYIWPCSWSTPVTTEWFELQFVFQNDLSSGATCHRGPARFRSKVPPCRGSGRTKYRTPPFGGCWSAIWRNSWVIISFQTGVKSDRACSCVPMFIIVHPCSQQKASIGLLNNFLAKMQCFILLRSSMDRIKHLRNSLRIEHPHQDEENFPIENEGFPPLLCLLESSFQSIIAP